MKKVILFFLIVISSACGRALNKDVEAAMNKYDEMILHTDPKGIAAMFTADGELAAPGMNSIHGRDSIQKFLEQFAVVNVLEQKSTTDSIGWSGDTAIQYGTYYQKANVNNVIAEARGMFEAKWITDADGKLMLKKMSALRVNK